MDMYLRLDMELKRLFDALDEQVGQGRWTAFLSADHGGANVPSHAASMGLPTGYWKPGNLVDKVEEELQDRWGFTPAGEPWILRHSNDQIFLNHPLIHQRGLDRDAMARFVAERCANEPGLSKAVAACDAPAMAANDPVVARLVRGHRPGPLETSSWCHNPDGSTTAARAPPTARRFRQDTHVPALFLGSGVAHGETYKRISS